MEPEEERWVIPTRYGTSRVVTVRKLSSLIRGRKLHGLELVRREGGGQWAPLHQFAVYQAVVPHQGDASIVAQRRYREGLMRLAGVGVIALGCALVATTLHDPSEMIPLGLALVGLFLAVVWPVFRNLTGPLQHAAVTRRDDLAQRLSALLKPLAEKGIPVAQLQEAVLRLHRQRRALEQVDTDEGALEAERVQLLVQKQSGDPQLRRIAERQLDAVEARIAAFTQARQMRARLLTEEREILRRIGDFHRAPAALTGPGVEAAVEDELARVKLEMQAVEEVEKILHRAQIVPTHR